MPTPSSPTILSATAASRLIDSAHPPLIIDARPASLHALERIRGAIPPPSTCTLPSLTFEVALVYDCGATTLRPPYSRAVLELQRLCSIVPADVSLYLVEGGLGAIRTVAPHLVAGPTLHLPDAIPQKLLKFPWAVRALKAARLESAPPARILPSLYVGAATHASDAAWLTRHDVTHVLAVGEEFTAPAIPEHSFEWLRLPVRDHCTEAISRHFPQAIAFLDQSRAQRGVTLVHCLAGASRSVATVAAYLIYHGWALDDALDHIKALRPAANPNTGFMEQLRHWTALCEQKRNQNVNKNEERLNVTLRQDDLALTS